ncbi:MAG: hypothetical protein FWB71_00655 [Defluviitaleaceae bacterium]|nr:hypothetical protein [Defluviitaleaceae bacterium]
MDRAEITQLLNDKLTAVCAIRKITQEIVPAISENIPFDDRAEAFSDMYADRETIIGEIAKIDARLAGADFSPAGDAQYEEILTKISDEAKAIVELDKEHAEITADLADQFRENIRRLRLGANASSVYSEDSDSGGHYFDKKN